MLFFFNDLVLNAIIISPHIFNSNTLFGVYFQVENKSATTQ